MENKENNFYEELRLGEADKIQKIGFFERLFKKDSKMQEEDLGFLEERYNKEVYQENHQENGEYFDEDLILPSPYKEQLQEVVEEYKEGDSLSVAEKEEILEATEEQNLPFQFVAFTLIAIFLTLLVFVPKIYIRNNIYYSSRNIIQLQAQMSSLNEENKFIKSQLEDIKFKNLTHELDF
ncbi:hypothetical protein B6S12_01285 [Helicobacter valdiviensis]|uniref:Uncharacterized protein n=1 Tax=Helicobacter valdiviensis TaxID=1458358 RepID=A0A2W6MWQ9_9HELI|nr:hypothetical protein [Helicobacter valdiviensis]PZT48955.1 hypothetical protein B6S12_01285 [Helicobacter valdiviensis]